MQTYLVSQPAHPQHSRHTISTLPTCFSLSHTHTGHRGVTVTGGGRGLTSLAVLCRGVCVLRAGRLRRLSAAYPRLDRPANRSFALIAATDLGRPSVVKRGVCKMCVVLADLQRFVDNHQLCMLVRRDSGGQDRLNPLYVGQTGQTG